MPNLKLAVLSAVLLSLVVFNASAQVPSCVQIQFLGEGMEEQPVGQASVPFDPDKAVYVNLVRNGQPGDCSVRYSLERDTFAVAPKKSELGDKASRQRLSVIPTQERWETYTAVQTARRVIREGENSGRLFVIDPKNSPVRLEPGRYRLTVTPTTNDRRGGSVDLGFPACGPIPQVVFWVFDPES